MIFKHEVRRSMAFLLPAFFVLTAGVSTAGHSSCPTLAKSFSANDRRQALLSISSAGEALPRGVNHFMNWRTHGRVGIGNNAQQYSAFVPWGQVFPQEGGDPIVPAAIEVRDLRAYVLSRRTQRWKLVSRTDQIQGRLFLPNFDRNESVAADVEFLPNRTRVKLDSVRPFHFWPAQGRVAIDGADVSGILVVFQSRVVAGKPGGNRYVVSAGGDYWKTPGSVWQNYTTNGDAGIGRFTIPSAKWRRSFMYTGQSGDFTKCIE
ncbi:hypothetical protein [Sphingomonas sp. OK281]|uniref:hypothetical protein n=1 Tax=Sphingomonas sp. OK281 TaxID=1881067 RepID=UPI0008E5FE9A|nr:hypothetical protein [Sphingomonas sp. OK281]SFN67163.1 hypothetical protein SAMN05428984_0069 [Sphingomonas sp. OK281]